MYHVYVSCVHLWHVHEYVCGVFVCGHVSVCVYVHASRCMLCTKRKMHCHAQLLIANCMDKLNIRKDEEAVNKNYLELMKKILPHASLA